MSLDSTIQVLKTELSTYLDWLVSNTDRTSTVPDILTDAPVVPEVIMFSYVIDDLFEDVKMTSAIRTKSIRDQSGKPLLDAYAITDDERTWFDKELKEGSKRVFNVISPMAKNIPTPYLYDTGVTIVDYLAVTTYQIGDYVRDNGSVYKALAVLIGVEPTGVTDANWELQTPLVDTKGKVVYLIEVNDNIPSLALTLMDGDFLAALRLYILKQWYKIVSLIEEAGLKEQEYTQVVLALRSDSYKRIKPIIRPATDLSF